MKRIVFAAVALAAFFSAGCWDFLTTKTSPTTTTTTTLSTGDWSSVSSATTLTNTCTDFHWNITSVTGADTSGTFSAKCMGTLQVNGTAHGVTSGSNVTWAAETTGTTSSGSVCAAELTGTATFDGTQLRIPFTGTTCLGAVSGTEVLRKG